MPHDDEELRVAPGRTSRPVLPGARTTASLAVGGAALLLGAALAGAGSMPAVRTTALVSVSATGPGGAAGNSTESSVCATGRFVAFSSVAGDLTGPGKLAPTDVFVRDLKRRTTTRVTASAAGGGSTEAYRPSVSRNGRTVAFVSVGAGLVPEDANAFEDVYVRDVAAGSTRLVSVNADGTAAGNSWSRNAAISANGRYVAFESYAKDLVPGAAASTYDVFVRDLAEGTTIVLTTSPSGNAGASSCPAISSTGRFVAFWSYTDDLVPDDGNGLVDVFVRDTVRRSTRFVPARSVGISGAERLSVSDDGRYVAFRSAGTGLVPAPTDADSDVYVRDLRRGTTTLVSVNAAGTAGGNDSSVDPSMSADGRYVVFASSASDLVANDTNGSMDVFLRDLKRRTTRLVSANAAGTGGGASWSYHPSICADGRYVSFVSQAPDLCPDELHASINVYLRRVR